MAVYTSNIEISEWSGSLFDSATLPRNSTSDSFSRGDLVDSDDLTGAVGLEVVDSAEGAYFIGVSRDTIDGSIDTTSKVNVATKCVIRGTCTDEIFFGESAYYSAGDNGTTWTFTQGAAQALVHCRSQVIAAAAYGLFLVDPFTLRAATLLGFFEIPTT